MITGRAGKAAAPSFYWSTQTLARILFDYLTCDLQAAPWHPGAAQTHHLRRSPSSLLFSVGHRARLRSATPARTHSPTCVTASSSHKEIYHARFRQECSEVQRLASSTDALQLRLSSTSYLQPDPTAFLQIAFQSIQLTLEDLSRLMKVHLYTTASYAHMDHHYITFRKRKLPYRSQAATYTVNQKNVFFDIQSTKPDRLW